MKKIGKKFSFLTKVMLVLGLIFTDLAPLKIVFASEKDEALQILVNEDKLNIKYTEELTDEVVDIVVNETYTYLDETQKNASSTYSDVTALSLKEGIDYATIADDAKFDGTYTVVVKLQRKINETESELIATNDYTFNKAFEEGINISVVDTSLTPVLLTNGVYNINPSTSYNTVVKFNAGGLAPTWTYTVNENTYTGADLLEEEFKEAINLDGHLKGEHTITRAITLSSENFESDKNYTKDINLMYGTYNQNNEILNTAASELGLDNIYKFASSTKDGTLFVYPDLATNKLRNVIDIINILNKAIGESEIISYTISNGTEEIQNKYLEYKNSFIPDGIEEMLTEEAFYEEYMLNDNYVITLTCGDLTITYKVICFGDTNEDGIVTEEDLTTIIDKVLEVKDPKLPNDDLTDDNILNLDDVVYLQEVLKTKDIEINLGTVNGTIDAYLNNTKNNIVSEDTFDIEYVLSVKDYTTNGIKGQIKYDETLFELVSITNNTEWVGNNKNGKFLYIGENSLERKIVETPKEEPLVDENDVMTVTQTVQDESELQYETQDYVVLKATFKAKKAGTGIISVSDYEFVDGVNTLSLNSQKIETSVTINASSDNTLKSLTVGGNAIELKEDVLDYEITVENDITNVSVEAIPNSINGVISSLINPEELVEGENTITISVTAENGDVRIYTVKVIRKEAEEPKKVVQTTNKNPEKGNNDKEQKPTVDDKEPDDNINDNKENKDEGSKLSRIIIIILILLVISGLIYLIFKDNDEEVKAVDKEINKIKKADEAATTKPETKKVENKKPDNKKTNSKRNNNKEKH